MREDQHTVYEWTKTAFPGLDNQTARTVAVLEEAIELAVAAGLKPERILNVVNVTLAKVHKQKNFPGNDQEETADLLSCIYAYAGQRKFDAHEELDNKMVINRGRPLSYYREKTASKVAAGLETGASD